MHVDAPECTLPNYGAKKRVNTRPSLGSDVTNLSHNSSKQSWELTLFFFMMYGLLLTIYKFIITILPLE